MMHGTGMLMHIDVLLATDIEVSLYLKDKPEAFYGGYSFRYR